MDGDVIKRSRRDFSYVRDTFYLYDTRKDTHVWIRRVPKIYEFNKISNVFSFFCFIGYIWHMAHSRSFSIIYLF